MVPLQKNKVFKSRNTDSFENSDLLMMDEREIKEGVIRVRVLFTSLFAQLKGQHELPKIVISAYHGIFS